MDSTNGSLAELARSLGTVILTKKTKRDSTTILNIEYPAIELMPEGAELDVEQPTLVAQRERPPPDPRTIGIHDTSVFVVLPTSTPNPFAIRQSHDAVANLLTAIEVVTAEPGNGLLKMVSYSHDDGDSVQHHFQLTTASGQSATVLLADKEWRTLLKQQYRHPWLSMLSSLVYRRSARTYYHVRDRLYRAFGDHALAVDEQAWRDKWNSQPPKSARHLLYSRLRMTNEQLVPDQFAVLLPCGHYENIERIRGATNESAASSSFSCFQCGCRTLLPADDQELVLRTERRRTTSYTTMAVEWRDLDDQVLDHPIVNHMPACALRCALAAALASLRAPTWICPPELSFLHFAETKAVFDELDETLQDMDEVVIGSAQGLYEMLTDCVQVTRWDGLQTPLIISGLLPPGWSEDVKRWMTRTVNLLSQRSCSLIHPDHVGFHKHGRELRCGVQSPEAVEELELVVEESFPAEPVTSMAVLARMLAGTNIGDDPAEIDDSKLPTQQEKVESDQEKEEDMIL